MNIGIVVDNELNNDKRVLREIEILKEQGHDIFVLCYGFAKKYVNPVIGINITRINLTHKLKDILFFFQNTIPAYEWLWALEIRRFIDVNSIEILHVHDLYMSGAGHSGIKKARRKIPLILDLHENYSFAVTTYNWTKGFLRSLISRPKKWQIKEKEYLGYADRIIVLSDDFREVLNKRYPNLPKENFFVLPNVPELPKSDYKRSEPVKVLFRNESPVILYFGVIAERRGVFDALRVFLDLVKEDYPVNFLFIGPVDKKDKRIFFKLIKAEMLKDHVHYIPWIDLPELPSYLEISDICIAPFHINPQHESGVANKIFDYMFGKKPIIASDCRPQRKLIEKYNCGIIYRNDEEMKEAIKRLSENRQLRNEMGQNGYKAINEEYNIEKNKIILKLLFNNLI